jgi:hypothetical protein
MAKGSVGAAFFALGYTGQKKSIIISTKELKIILNLINKTNYNILSIF